MAAKLLVSIIVPLYNEEVRAFDLVEHVESLDGVYDVVLVDASNQVKSQTIISKLKESAYSTSKVRFVSTNHPGRALQMNLGAGYAQGDILVFLHCDTRLPINAMQLVRESITSGSCWGRFDLSLDSEGLIYRVIECMIGLRSRLRRIATGDQALFVTKEVFNNCGGYPSIPLMEDIAICKRLNRYSEPDLIKKRVVTSARRWRNAGVIRTILLMWTLRFLFWIGVDSNRLASMYGNDR